MDYPRIEAEVSGIEKVFRYTLLCVCVVEGSKLMVIFMLLL